MAARQIQKGVVHALIAYNVIHFINQPLWHLLSSKLSGTNDLQTCTERGGISAVHSTSCSVNGDDSASDDKFETEDEPIFTWDDLLVVERRPTALSSGTIFAPDPLGLIYNIHEVNHPMRKLYDEGDAFCTVSYWSNPFFTVSFTYEFWSWAFDRLHSILCLMTDLSLADVFVAIIGTTLFPDREDDTVTYLRWLTKLQEFIFNKVMADFSPTRERILATISLLYKRVYLLASFKDDRISSCSRIVLKYLGTAAVSFYFEHIRPPIIFIYRKSRQLSRIALFSLRVVLHIAWPLVSYWLTSCRVLWKFLSSVLVAREIAHVLIPFTCAGSTAVLLNRYAMASESGFSGDPQIAYSHSNRLFGLELIYLTVVYHLTTVLVLRYSKEIDSILKDISSATLWYSGVFRLETFNRWPSWQQSRVATRTSDCKQTVKGIKPVNEPCLGTYGKSGRNAEFGFIVPHNEGASLNNPLIKPKPNLALGGLTLRPDGTMYVPASMRPDGSMRREIHIRAGYIDQELYDIYCPRRRRVRPLDRPWRKLQPTIIPKINLNPPLLPSENGPMNTKSGSKQDAEKQENGQESSGSPLPIPVRADLSEIISSDFDSANSARTVQLYSPDMVEYSLYPHTSNAQSSNEPEWRRKKVTRAISSPLLSRTTSEGVPSSTSLEPSPGLYIPPFARNKEPSFSSRPGQLSPDVRSSPIVEETPESAWLSNTTSSTGSLDTLPSLNDILTVAPVSLIIGPWPSSLFRSPTERTLRRWSMSAQQILKSRRSIEVLYDDSRLSALNMSPYVENTSEDVHRQDVSTEQPATAGLTSLVCQAGRDEFKSGNTNTNVDIGSTPRHLVVMDPNERCDLPF